MNILLTGGAGYIGSHTIIELDKAGHSVVVVDNLVNSNPESLRRVSKIIGKEIPFYEVDVRDKENLSKVFDANKIDAVIHFAGLKAVGESVSKPLEYYHNNMTGTFILLEVMRQHGCKNIIFSSSSTSSCFAFSVSSNCADSYVSAMLFLLEIRQAIIRVQLLYLLLHTVNLLIAALQKLHALFIQLK